MSFDSLNAKLDRMVTDDRMEELLTKCCLIVERSAKENAPTDTGALKRSITSRVEGHTGIVFTNFEYAPYIEYGTGLFGKSGKRITPRKAKALHWTSRGGEEHFAKSVAGMKPRPFLIPALQKNRERILEILKKGMTT